MNKALKNREDLVSFRDKCKAHINAERKKILVCAGPGCISSGSDELYKTLKALLKEKGIPCEVSWHDDPCGEVVGVKNTGCHGFCELGPLIRIEPEGWLYTKVMPSDCGEIIEKTIVNGEHIERLAYKEGDTVYKNQDDVPFYKKQTKRVLHNCGTIEADSVNEYLAADGYSAFEKALFDMTSDDIIQIMSDANLRGRGGAGFPAGRKWSQVKRQASFPKYVVCNGDEGDPGAFMDRSIMEGDPHSVIEGMMLAGLATGASEGYIYVRAEYPIAVLRLQTAIDRATELGLLGSGILGTDFCFNMHINKGAGAFVCGEGSALTASIEGRRGMPRVKPPRTVEHGLFNQPTVLNNVETLASVPSIILNGADWYKEVGTEGSPGTKAFALAGNVRNTGLIEIPMGTSIKEVVFDIGGGMRGGKEFKAVQIGGPSGGCLTKDHLDMKLDFDSLKKAGAIVGSGGLVIMDENTCMVEVAHFFMSFTQNESCGKCVPCREGTKQMLTILDRIVAGEGKEGDIELLLELADVISSTALCGLGKSAAFPVVSTIENFRDEYEAHIKEKRCPAGSCEKLKVISIDPRLCKGCSKCVKVCPVDAISGKIKEPFVISQEKCVKCGACVSTCPFGAILEA